MVCCSPSQLQQILPSPQHFNKFSKFGKQLFIPDKFHSQGGWITEYKQYYNSKVFDILIERPKGHKCFKSEKYNFGLYITTFMKLGTTYHRMCSNRDNTFFGLSVGINHRECNLMLADLLWSAVLPGDFLRSLVDPCSLELQIKDKVTKCTSPRRTTYTPAVQCNTEGSSEFLLNVRVIHKYIEYFMRNKKLYLQQLELRSRERITLSPIFVVDFSQPVQLFLLILQLLVMTNVYLISRILFQLPVSALFYTIIN